MKIKLLLPSILLAGCATLATGSGPSISSLNVQAPSPVSIVDAVPGQAYALGMFTQCGLRAAQINGDWWQVKTDEPQTGLGVPWDMGSVTLTDTDHAVWTGSDGIKRDLTRGGEAPQPCF